MPDPEGCFLMSCLLTVIQWLMRQMGGVGSGDIAEEGEGAVSA